MFLVPNKIRLAIAMELFSLVCLLLGILFMYYIGIKDKKLVPSEWTTLFFIMGSMILLFMNVILFFRMIRNAMTIEKLKLE